MDYESEAAINQALKLAETSLNIEEVLRKQFLTKIHFEKLICYYLHNNIAASLDSLDYVVDYLSKNTVEGNEHIIVIVSHNIVYILYDILKKDPPKKWATKNIWLLMLECCGTKAIMMRLKMVQAKVD